MPSDPTRYDYGPDPSQFGELTRPDGPARGTVVVVHGGFWRAAYGLELGRPLAADLAARGYTAWNVEYRRVGIGGGWPATLDDVAAALDRLADPFDGSGVDTGAVVAVGHSAGGHLATWLAGRPGRPPGAPGGAPRVRLRGVVAQAGVLDLAVAARTGVGRTAVLDLLGGGPDDVPERYAVTDPIVAAPLPVPVLCLHAAGDDDVPIAQSRAYVAVAGDAARLVEVPGDHFTLIEPQDVSWQVVRDALPSLLAGRLP